MSPPWLERLAMTARATPSVACLTEAEGSPNLSRSLPISCTMYGSKSLHIHNALKSMFKDPQEYCSWR